MKAPKSWKVYALMLILPILFTMCSAVRAEESATIAYPVTGGNIYFDPTTGTITGCDDTVTEAIVPASIEGHKVEIIGDSAFRGKDNLTKVVLPEGITTVCQNAFSFNFYLESVYLPGTITDMGESVFIFTTKLHTAGPAGGGYDIEYGWKEEMPTCAFHYAGLKSIVVADGITTLGAACFYSNGITEMVLPDSVTTIGGSAFSQCDYLESIELSDNLISIGYQAFNGCSQLQSISLPESLQTIDDRAFFGCDLSGSVFIPWRVRKIGHYVFANNKNLMEINVDGRSLDYRSMDGVLFTQLGFSLLAYPAGRTGGYSIPDDPDAYMGTIEEGAFYRCDNLTDIKIPYGVTYIDPRAFFYCTSLKTVTMPGSITEIADYAFSNCTALESVHFDGTEQQWEDVKFWEGNEPLQQAAIEFYYHTVTVTAGANGTATASTDVAAEGQYVDFNATPDTGYHLKQWTITSGNGTINRNRLRMGTSDVVIEAEFEYDGLLVTFDPNGGTCSPSSKGVNPGETYGTLATATRPGYTFDGWYTAANGGTRITETTKVTTTEHSQTLYAHWTKNPDDAFTWGRDNWNFINSSDYFSSGRFSGQISKSYLDVLARNLTNTEYDWIFDRQYGWLYDTWGGSCYGMSSLAFLSKRGLFPYSRYKAGATCLYQMNYPLADMQISSLINYYQLLQIKDVIQQQYRTVPSRTNKENISQIISLLNENSTVLVCFQQDNWGGHAILAYGYEYGSWTWNGVTYQGHIKICDPNSSMRQNDRYDVYFNTSTYRWIIPTYRVGSATGGVFSYVGVNVSEINEGGYLSGGSSRSISNYVGRLGVMAASGNRSVRKVVERSGSYVTQTNATDDIVEAYSFVPGNESQGAPGYNLFDSDSAYRVSQTEPVELDLNIDYENCVLRGHSYAGENIVFDKKGLVSIQSESADYEMAMTFNDGYPTRWFKIQVSGSNANSVTIEAAPEGYIVTGDNLENVVASASNRTDTAQIAFSTQFPSVLLYEKNSTTLGARVDTDNDGVYDTDLDSITLFKVPEALERIDESAFEGCAFTHVVLGDRVTTIDASAFANCPNLVYIEIPQFVTSIADDAFSGSDGVTIMCKKGSVAHEFAENHGISYRTTG